MACSGHTSTRRLSHEGHSSDSQQTRKTELRSDYLKSYPFDSRCFKAKNEYIERRRVALFLRALQVG